MIMLFGKQEDFAIEAQVEGLHGKWLFGRLRLYVGGESLGRFDETSDLAGSARGGRILLRASPQRSRPDLDAEDALTVFDLLYGRYVVPAAGAPPKVLAGRWVREPYLLDDLGEASLRDRFAAILVRRGDGADRAVVKRYEDGVVSETVVRLGVCDRTIDAYCCWVEGILLNGAGP
jgi:hypothetical protein